MKYFLKILFFPAFILLLNACSKSNDLYDWRDENIAAYKAIKENPEYKELRTETGPEGVYYKVLKTGTGTEYPFQTSKVKIFYRGTYYNGTVFDEGSGGSNIPKEFSTNSTVRGFSFALQNMVVGDKWEIWIPYNLGYGIVGLYDNYTYRTIIKGYTTLVFEVELVEIIQYPD